MASGSLNLGQDNTTVTDSTGEQVEHNDLVDRGNHEDVVNDEPPTINDKGELVDADGNKVFTTTEEAIKDGSFVLDHKGRMPGVYLDDVEAFEREDHIKRVEEAFEKSEVGVNSLVERQVNIPNSPLPPVTVVSRQENPVSED